MTSAEVTEFNAYRYSDNFTVQVAAEPKRFIGCEHNQTEADALAKYLTSETGQKHEVIRNGRDVVAAAKQFRPQPLRFEHRDEAFATMRVY
jgi:hypothetical protein